MSSDANGSASHAQRRAVPRYVFRRSGHFHVPAKQPFAIKTLDISLQGIGLMSPHSIPAGQECAIRVPVFQDDGATAELIVRGEVMCCILAGTEGFRIGVKFSQVDERTKKLLARIVQNCFS